MSHGRSQVSDYDYQTHNKCTLERKNMAEKGSKQMGTFSNSANGIAHDGSMDRFQGTSIGNPETMAFVSQDIYIYKGFL